MKFPKFLRTPFLTEHLQTIASENLTTLTNLQILSNFPKTHELFLDQTLIRSTSLRDCIYFYQNFGFIYVFAVAFNFWGFTFFAYFHIFNTKINLQTWSALYIYCTSRCTKEYTVLWFYLMAMMIMITMNCFCEMFVKQVLGKLNWLYLFTILHSTFTNSLCSPDECRTWNFESWSNKVNLVFLKLV